MNVEYIAKISLSLLFTSLFVVFYPVISFGSSTDVKPQGFKITDLDGFLSVRYVYDERVITDAGSEIQDDRKPTHQQELRLNAKGYVYHPNFLSLDLGGSLLLDQSEFKSDQSDNSTNQELFSFNTRLDFLKKKPYPVSVYYSKQNPSVSTGLTGHFLQENIKYGIDFALLNPVTPVQVTVKAFKETSDGEGFDQIIDEIREQTFVKLYYPYSNGDYAQLTHQINTLDSESGSINLPIQARLTTTKTTNLDTRNAFGANRNILLTANVASRERQEYPVQKELSLAPNISWEHSETLGSYYQFNISELKEEDIETDRSHIVAGIGSHSDSYNSGFKITGESTSSDELEYESIALNYDISNVTKFSYGDLKLSYKANFDMRHQTSQVSTFGVFGEEHTLESTLPVVLSRSSIDTGTIVVSNQSRTQTYIEDLDYRLILVGVQVQLQRLVGGNIIDGQTVVVDYDYETGGSFDYDVTSHYVTANWGISRFFDIYTRYTDVSPELQDDTTTNIKLNNIESLTYGFKTERALLNGMIIGVDVYREDLESLDQFQADVNSYIKDNLDYFFELPLSKQTNIRFSGRKVIKEYDTSIEGNDIDGYILRVNSRPALRVTSTLESSYERDTGGTVNRLTRMHRLIVRWKMRQLKFDASLRYIDEEQGTIDRENWEVKMELRRDLF